MTSMALIYQGLHLTVQQRAVMEPWTGRHGQGQEGMAWIHDEEMGQLPSLLEG